MVLVFFCCFLGGFFFAYLLSKLRKKSFEQLTDQMLLQTEREIEEKRKQFAKEQEAKEFEQKKSLEDRREEFFEKIAREKERLDKKEDVVDQKRAAHEKKVAEFEQKMIFLSQEKNELERERKKLQEKEQLIVHELERISKITANEAKELLKKETLNEAKQEASQWVSHIKEEAENEARGILVTSINRLSLATVSELTTTTVLLPNVEIKRRIIGREGKNIRTFEQTTGVNLVIDDAPNVVVLSCFDPIRKEIAKLALKELLKDGRIHPVRIEAAVKDAKEQLEKEIKKIGERAAMAADIGDLHSDLIFFLGRLHFCAVDGQNLLQHSLEVSHLMGIIASELRLNVQLAKRIGLLHDIGKSLPHEMEGSHAFIGAAYAAKCGESESVVNGIQCHEDEVSPTTLEASLCNTANRISKEREGARSESLHQYVKRSQKLESLVSQLEGIESVYAFQAGKEIRVIVTPNHFDDARLSCLAHEIAKKIEKEATYSGKIKVTVIQEKKFIEYAT